MQRVMKTDFKRRKGMTLFEVMILLVVLAVTLGAVFSTMAWASKSYAFGRQDKKSREVLFCWVQTFESLWPTKPQPGESLAEWKNKWKDWGFLNTEAQKQIKLAGEKLGVWDSGKNRAIVEGCIVTVTPVSSANGKMDLRVTISSGNKTLVELTRSYNVYSSDTVSDDVMQGS